MPMTFWIARWGARAACLTVRRCFGVRVGVRERPTALQTMADRLMIAEQRALERLYVTPA